MNPNDRVYDTLEWPRPGQIARAWGLFSPMSSGGLWMEGIYERYADAEEDGTGTGNYHISVVEIMFGTDEEWHVLRTRLHNTPPRPMSKKGAKRVVAARARSKLTKAEKEALGI